MERLRFGGEEPDEAQPVARSAAENSAARIFNGCESATPVFLPRKCA